MVLFLCAGLKPRSVAVSITERWILNLETLFRPLSPELARVQC